VHREYIKNLISRKNAKARRNARLMKAHSQNTSFAYFMRTASYLPEAVIQLHLSIRSNTHQKYDEGKHTVVAGLIHPGPGDQRRQAGNEIQRPQHHMRGAVAVAKRGLELLAEAINALPDVPDVRYHYGVSLMKSDKVAEGRQQLRELVDGGLPFEGRVAAERLLDKN
jgi:hypothetical protein